MARISLPNNGLIVDIPGNFQVGTESYTRRLFVKKMDYDFIDKYIKIDGLIRFYESGAEVTNSLIAKPYIVSIKANNTDLVDTTTGEVLSKTEDEYNGSILNPVLVGKDYAEQFDWFFDVGDSQPIIVHDMIRNFLMVEIQNGRFN